MRRGLIRICGRRAGDGLDPLDSDRRANGRRPLLGRCPRIPGANLDPRRYRRLGQPVRAPRRCVPEGHRGGGAVLKPLPPYSPDLSPIAQAFSKLKAGLRQAGRRTAEALWESIAEVLNQFTPAEYAHYFQDAGYPYKRDENALSPFRKILRPANRAWRVLAVSAVVSIEDLARRLE